MKLHLSLLLEPCLKNSSVILSVSIPCGLVKTIELKDDSLQNVEYQVELNYLNLPKSIKIFRVDGLVEGLGQKIIIREMKINDRPVEKENFFNLLDFYVQDNKFIFDHLIDNSNEISSNGEILLAVEKNRDRLFWCPFYYSSSKDDFVFNNTMLNDYGSGPRPWPSDQRSFVEKYRNSPHHDYEINKVYDIACFGCSVTYGSALDVKNIWPNLLSANSLCLAVPGLGIDGIFLNLKNALKKFQFRKIIILLPNFERRLVRLRIPALGGFCRMPIHIGGPNWSHGRFKHWAWEQIGIQFEKNWVDDWKKEYNKKFLRLLLDENCVYGKRVLSLLLRLCDTTDKKFYFSSWDQEVYDYMVDTMKMSTVLPFFKSIDRALDNNHPGVASHAAWADEVSKFLSLGGEN